jgi:hypothetical protein
VQPNLKELLKQAYRLMKNRNEGKGAVNTIVVVNAGQPIAISNPEFNFDVEAGGYSQKGTPQDGRSEISIDISQRGVQQQHRSDHRTKGKAKAMF